MPFVLATVWMTICSFAHAATDPWQPTLERVERGVVSLEVTATRDFDTEDAATSSGTGFVVDAERGLILTNRHLVHPGPVVAEAGFGSGEWASLVAVYRDPVHDFGLFSYDPDSLEYTQPEALELAADAAEVGLEVRVIGNDAGERNTILDGTLARLDRNAPRYGKNAYNDFNTFYYQAAANTSGGSSGSPVVDVHGRVVALNSGASSRAASSFYLPLYAIQRALAKIVAGEPVPRGTLQTTFRYTAYGDLELLGLTPEGQRTLRTSFPDGGGALVVESTVPDGPGDGELLAGDVLVSLNGEPLGDFDTLERWLDSHVGGDVRLGLERGGVPLERVLAVDDLQAITPARFLEVGRAVLNDVSYQLARSHSVPPGRPFVASPGYMFSTGEVGEGTVITHVDGVEVFDIDELRVQLEGKAARQRLRIRFYDINDPRRPMEKVVSMERTWFGMRSCTWDPNTGGWPCVSSPAPPAQREANPPSASVRSAGSNRIEERVGSSLVTVHFDVPYPTAGITDLHYVGVGVVISARRGLVLVDRDTVPVSLGDVIINVAGAARVPAQVTFLHPVFNYAIIQFDPTIATDAAITSATFSTRDVQVGDAVWQVGLDADLQLVSERTTVHSEQWLDLGTAGTPRFRAANTDTMGLEDDAASLGGVVTDRRGAVVAIWSSFLDVVEKSRSFHAMPVRYLDGVVAPLISGQAPTQRLLGVEVEPMRLAEAVELGVSAQRVAKILDQAGKSVRQVTRVVTGSGAEGLLHVNDILVAIDGRPVSSARDLLLNSGDHVTTVTVVRSGHELSVRVPADLVEGVGVVRCLSWAGLVLHEPHHEVAAQTGAGDEGVYVAWMWYGSPAVRYGIRPTRRIVQVNEIPTPNLDAFLGAVSNRSHGDVVRLTLEGLDGQRYVRPLELDLNFWPTEVFARVDGVWTRSVLPE